MAQEEGLCGRKEIAFGQAHRGNSVKDLDIGNCCSRADYCVKGCPPTANDVLAMLRVMER